MVMKFSGISYEECCRQTKKPFTFSVCLTFCFSLLAALYESWGSAFAVMLAVPIGVSGHSHTYFTALTISNNDAQIG